MDVDQLFAIQDILNNKSSLAKCNIACQRCRTERHSDLYGIIVVRIAAFKTGENFLTVVYTLVDREQFDVKQPKQVLLDFLHGGL